MIDEGMKPDEILKALFDDVQVIGMSTVAFKCNCSRERMFDALGTVCQKELDTMIYEDHGAEMTCHFCNTHYRFSEEELRSIKVKN
jgi:molecular chaperone Hsp33